YCCFRAYRGVAHGSRHCEGNALPQHPLDPRARLELTPTDENGWVVHGHTSEQKLFVCHPETAEVWRPNFYDKQMTVYDDQMTDQAFENSAVSARAATWLKGSRTVNVAPCPSMLSICSRPRWRLTMCLTSARPSPVPPSARLCPTSTR